MLPDDEKAELNTLVSKLTASASGRDMAPREGEAMSRDYWNDMKVSWWDMAPRQ